MFERPRSGERAVLVHINFPKADAHEDLFELEELVKSAGATSVANVVTKRQTPEAKYFVGTGKAEEIRQIVLASHADLVIINHSLSPAQERNLEQLLHCRVIDRTGLILDIFAQRARTFEGKLQVELAQLKHLSTRLVRGWTHLERQKGGIGLRGPGETQLETDKRLIRIRIKTISERLAKVRIQRAQGRRARHRSSIPLLALVGYTNAGKSTLFNRLSDDSVYAANQLFATLDPTLRRVLIASLGPVILADTVGFIRHLPHDLVDAFRATLEEIRSAALLLHIVDAAAENRDGQIEQVQHVLAQIGADDLPQLQVFNKVDLLTAAQPQIERDAQGQVKRVWLSAAADSGISLLHQALAEILGQNFIECCIKLQPTEAQLRASLFLNDQVLNEQITANGDSLLHIRLPQTEYIKCVASQHLPA